MSQQPHNTMATRRWHPCLPPRLRAPSSPKSSWLPGLITLLILSLGMMGCHSHGGHSHGGHSHGGHGGHGDHGGHGHGHGHGGESETGAAISVTLFTKATELFMEYNPLVAGRKASFLAHLTILGKAFQPVRRGRLSVDFMQGGRQVAVLVAQMPLREGIFKPEGKAPAAGTYTLRLRLTTDDIADTITVPNAVIYPTVKAAKKANPKQPEAPNEISFLKEQQWKIPFATVVASRRELRDGLRLSGTCEALPSGHARLAAPIAGKIGRIAKNVREGHQLKAGQQLLYIEPILFSGTSLPQLNQRVQAAEAALKLRKFQLNRMRKMVKARAVGSWQLSELKHQINLHQAQLQSAKARRQLFYRSRRQGSGRSHAVVVRAPFAGVLLRRYATQGSFVTQGQPLAEMASLKQLRLTAQLPEYYAAKAHQIQSATYQLSSGPEHPLPKPEAIGAYIDPKTRTLPLYFQLTNPGHLLHGQHVTLRVHLSKRRGLAVPAGAVVDDRGTPVVFVQAGGEAFLKKTVKTGIRDGKWVEIRAGLKAGERVVSLGAYEILLTLALKQAGAMDHGHAH